MAEKDPITGGVIPSEFNAKSTAQPAAQSAAKPAAPTVKKMPSGTTTAAPAQRSPGPPPAMSHAGPPSSAPPGPPGSGPAGRPPGPPMSGRPAGEPEHGHGSAALILVLGAILFLGMTLFMVVINNLGGENNPIANALGMAGADIYGFFFNVTNILFGMLIVLAFLVFVSAMVIFGMGKKSHRPTGGSKKTMIVSAILMLVFMGFYAGAYMILQPKIKAAQQEVKRDVKQIVATEAATGQDAITGSAPYEVVFKFSEVKDPSVEYVWDFGDRSDIGRGHSVRHIFKEMGGFDVILTTTAQDKTENTYAKRIIIENILAEVNIQPSVTEGDAPLEVFFDGTRSKDIGGDPLLAYNWDFADLGSDQKTAEGQKVAHTFYQPGSYEVALTVTDSSGAQSTGITTITVDDPGSKPRAIVITEPNQLTAKPPFKVEFNASGSYDPEGGTIQEYLWDFGDNSDREYGKRISHTFQKSGKYTTKLVITTSEGIKVTKEIPIIVQNEEVAPTAKITAESKLKGEAPYTFEVTGKDSDDVDGTIVQYEWDFGDKTTIQTGADTSHIFTRPGTYIIRLEVTDDTDRMGTDVVEVVVSEAQEKAPRAIITADPHSGIVPLTVQFDGTGSSDRDGQIIAYVWEFGDGSPPLQTQGKISHRFDNVGTYTVKLTVSDDDGLKGETTTSIAVNRVLPVAQIESSNTIGVAPTEISFSAANSTGYLEEFRWDFGDGTIRYGAEVTHTYYDAGVYTVSLTVVDGAGIEDTKTTQISISSQ